LIPEQKELIEYIGRHEPVNYSLIAKFYDINNATVSDLIDALVKKKLVVVKIIGANKIVMVKKEGKNA
jgi:DNA-binding MarR family transcriptional regulator